MRKFFILPIVILIICGLIFGCQPPTPSPTPTPGPAPSPAPAPKPEAIKLVIAMWEGTEGAASPPLRQWVADLEEKSGGRITGEIAYGGVMGKPPEHYDLAATGVADVAYVGYAYTPGRFPMAEAYQLPIASGPTQEQLAVAMWRLYQKGYFDQEFSDTHPLYFNAVGPYELHMGKGQFVRTFDDIKGIKLRASGAVHTDAVKRLGGIPVGMPAPEVYVSLEKGVVDGAFVPRDFIFSFRTDPVLSSVTEAGFCGFNFGLHMNLDVWNKLPDDLKAIVDEVSGEQTTAFNGAEHDRLAKTATDFLIDAGGEVIKLPAADLDKISTALTPMWEDWIGGDTKKKQFIDDFYNILKDMGVAKPLHGYTP
jgi:TRAP-type C4-dicarboxylate transport system substrate-binding protein